MKLNIQTIATGVVTLIVGLIVWTTLVQPFLGNGRNGP